MYVIGKFINNSGKMGVKMNKKDVEKEKEGKGTALVRNSEVFIDR